MDAIEILRRCRTAERDIERLRIMIRQRREIIDRYARAPGAGGPREPSGPLARILTDTEALEGRLRNREERKAAETAAACVLLDRLPELENRVLYALYLRGDTIAAAAKRLRYSEGYVRKIKARGESALGTLRGADVLAALPRWYAEDEKED